MKKIKLLLLIFFLVLPIAWALYDRIYPTTIIMNRFNSTLGNISTNIVTTNCTGQVLAYFYGNGTGVCEADDIGGNPFNQWLNTTNNVEFNNITAGNRVTANKFFYLNGTELVDTSLSNSTVKQICWANVTNGEWITPSHILDVDDEDIETDLNTYVDIAGDTMTGPLNVSNNITYDNCIISKGLYECVE